MFIKVNKSKNFFYLQLVTSYRENNKVKHKVITNLGRFDVLLGNNEIAKMGKKLLNLSGNQIDDIFDMREVDRFCYGDVVYKKIWDKFDIDGILNSLVRGSKITFNISEVVYLLVIDRLLKPRSKLASYNGQKKYININEISLQHIYRSLDILSAGKETIEEYLYERHKNLFNLSVDVVFYDVTTFHFESVREDELRGYGYSKAGKFNEVQIVMGLLVDVEGRPIGYDLYPGETFEGKTLEKILENLSKRFEIRRLIFVADKGLNSAENLHKIKRLGYDYIVSSKIKNSNKLLKKEILSEEGYNESNQIADEGEENHLKYKIIKDHKVRYKDESGHYHQLTDQLVITWSSKRAEMDMINRERQIRKAEERIKKKKKPENKKGANRYIATDGDIQIKGLDKRRIEEDAKWDGYYGIQTTESNLSTEKIIEHYHNLWRIEESFRIMKTTMKTRPIYHWTEKRIEGHFVLCFIAFLLERNLESKIKSNRIETSPEKIKSALNSLELSEIELNEQKYLLKGKSDSLANKLLNIFRIKHPENLILKEELNL